MFKEIVIAKNIIFSLEIKLSLKFFNLEEQMIAILIIFAVLPTAPSFFVLARQLGGDISLMSSIITVQTLLSVLFIILVLNYFV